jgi:high affinity choline transporter 7
MSSVDSSILSASSQFCWNVYRPLAKDASEKQLTLIFRLGIAVAGTAAALLALKVQSVYTLWFLCSDLVYVLLFPQLFMVLYFQSVNRRGALAGFIVGLFLRLGGGEPALGIQAFLPYPVESGEVSTWFPFRTFAMLASLITIWVVSNRIPRRIFQSGIGSNNPSK